MKIHFNTGRKYSPHGQRIAVDVERSVAIFHDYDRKVTGKIMLAQPDSLNATSLAEYVMSCYDLDQFRSTISAPEWMLRGYGHVMTSSGATLVTGIQA